MRHIMAVDIGGTKIAAGLLGAAQAWLVRQPQPLR
jgi:predicted NBD/HSP70 family sugar kinase